MAANTQGITGAFKVQMMEGVHNFNPGVHTLKAALYFQNSGIGPNTTVYSTSGEVTGANYTAGGIVVPNATGMNILNTTAYWTPSGNLNWPNLTISSPFDCWLLYNASAANASIGVFTFTAQVVNQTLFTISMPANVSTSALIQVN